MSERVQGNLSHGRAETENPNTNDDNEEERGNLLYHVPEWQQEFRHGLVDDSVRTPRRFQFVFFFFKADMMHMVFVVEPH